MSKLHGAFLTKSSSEEQIEEREQQKLFKRGINERKSKDPELRKRSLEKLQRADTRKEKKRKIMKEGLGFLNDDLRPPLKKFKLDSPSTSQDLESSSPFTSIFVDPCREIAVKNEPDEFPDSADEFSDNFEVPESHQVHEKVQPKKVQGTTRLDEVLQNENRLPGGFMRSRYKFRKLTGIPHCRYCDTVLVNMKEQKAHICPQLQCDDPNSFICRVCNKIIKKSSFVQHDHDTPPCPFCGKHILYWMSLKYHVEKVHKQKFVRPEVTEEQRQEYMKKKMEEEGEVLKERLKKGVHYMAKELPKKYVCDHCQEAFINSKALARHVLTHTAAVKFPCELCGKIYFDKNVLLGHQRQVHKIEMQKQPMWFKGLRKVTEENREEMLNEIKEIISELMDESENYKNLNREEKTKIITKLTDQKFPASLIGEALGVNKATINLDRMKLYKNFEKYESSESDEIGKVFEEIDEKILKLKEAKGKEKVSLMAEIAKMAVKEIQFKFLTPKRRVEIVSKLLDINFKLSDIAQVLKTSLRTIQRWSYNVATKSSPFVKSSSIDKDLEAEVSNLLDGQEFNDLNENEKSEVIEKLTEMGFGAAKISKALKCGERTVTRWRAINRNVKEEEIVEEVPKAKKKRKIGKSSSKSSESFEVDLKLESSSKELQRKSKRLRKPSKIIQEIKKELSPEAFPIPELFFDNPSDDDFNQSQELEDNLNFKSESFDEAQESSKLNESFHQNLAPSAEEIKSHPLSFSIADVLPSDTKRVKYKAQSFTGKPYCKYCDTMFKNHKARLAHDCEFLRCDEKNFICKICRKELSKRSFQNHNHEAKAACEYCGKTFKNPPDIKAHILKRHSDKIFCEKLFICDLCDCRVEDKNLLRLHMFVHKIYQCKDCGEEFNGKNRMEAHRSRTHRRNIDEVHPFHCIYCSRDFNTKENLQTHQKRIHNVGLKCESCQVAIETKEELIKHMKSFHGDLACQYCGKIFIIPSKLKSHEVRHETKDGKNRNYRSYTCNICDESFVNGAALNYHNRIHGASKGLTCELCGKGFIGINNLKAHQIKKHQIGLSCEICKEAMSDKEELKEHMKVHGTFECGICLKSFIGPKELKAHQHRKHFKDESKDANRVPCEFCTKKQKTLMPNRMQAHVFKFHKEKFEEWQTNSKLQNC